MLLWFTLHAAGVAWQRWQVYCWRSSSPRARRPISMPCWPGRSSDHQRNWRRRQRAAARTLAPAMHALDSIHDRIESPADRLLRNVEPWSSYLVLPLFALANAGLVLPLTCSMGAQPWRWPSVWVWSWGKPLGFLLAALLVIKSGIADRPEDLRLPAYRWRRRAGRHRLHHVAVHCRTCVPGSGGLRRGQSGDLSRFGAVRDDRLHAAGQGCHQAVVMLALSLISPEFTEKSF